MCKNFYDIRAFGAVMSTDVNCGQVRGPIQINFSRSIDRIVQQVIHTAIQIILVGIETKRKPCCGNSVCTFSAKLANDETKGTGFSEEDLELFWKALEEMFEHDHSAARGKMAARRLFVFKHKDELGNALSHKLFEMVKVEKNDGVVIPRKFGDYSVKVEGSTPEGVELIEKL